MNKIVRISGVILLILILHSCKEKLIPPAIQTTATSNVTYTTAISGGIITNEGGAPVVSRGVCWGTSANPTISNSMTIDGSGLGAFVSNITSLSPNTTYYVRAYALNSAGTGYGNQVSFTTIAVLSPVLTTTVITSVTGTTAFSGGSITTENGGAVTARGVCWNTSPNPTIANSITTNGTGTGSFVSNLSGLQPLTNYYVRSYATNSAGTGYGNEISFKTRSAVIVTDPDGNVYNTLTIGNQLWMAENLKTTKYKDNTNITIITDDVTWSGTGSSAYCWYNYNIINKEKYGALYNWYTINSGKLCPQGWHVPSDPEWTTLTTFLGGELVAGGKLKESGTTNWLSPNTEATNETGFTALPGGANSASSSFTSINTNAYFWSSTEYNTGASWPRGIHHDSGEVFRLTAAKKNGMSVRCIKD